MGRKSTKEDKSAYQLARERQELTREKASESMCAMSPERLEKIESGKTRIQPDDVLQMVECYKAPELCNYYCTHECAIGHKTVDEIEDKSFAQITIETLNALNKMDQQKERLLEIVEDGQVTQDEYPDFLSIKATLDKIAVSVHALQLWIDHQIAEGELDEELFEKKPISLNQAD